MSTRLSKNNFKKNCKPKCNLYCAIGIIDRYQIETSDYFRKGSKPNQLTL